jgi:hypothetical protein
MIGERRQQIVEIAALCATDIRPWRDCALCEREGAIRNDEIRIELQNASQTITGRACPRWIIEREIARFERPDGSRSVHRQA